MKKIIYSSNFTIHQKLILILIFIVTFFLGSLFLFGIIIWSIGVPDFQEYSLIDFSLAILFPISIIILIMLCCKKGIMIKNKKLYRSQFLFGNVILKKEIPLQDSTDISILIYQGTQKFSWSSMARPDQGYTVNSNKLYVLNTKHTIKKACNRYPKRSISKSICSTYSR
ncbi:hypothetical protein [Aquimarina aquimarini]|uniref:hypothetical protein n=1 Tax=Aquimarina aquimarini TaxID=1191734 RepID=UPI000D55BA49|nr:hypothetical protein [Aquimarina aquimarini]